MISVNNFTYYRGSIDKLSWFYRHTIVVLSTNYRGSSDAPNLQVIDFK